MHEPNPRSLSGEQPRSDRILASRAGFGATGIGLLLGGGAAVVAVRLFARRHGQGDRPPGQRIPFQSRGNLAAELFLVRGAAQLPPVPVRATGAHTHERRRSA
jgi:hypothetical protein